MTAGAGPNTCRCRRRCDVVFEWASCLTGHDGCADRCARLPIDGSVLMAAHSIPRVSAGSQPRPAPTTLRATATMHWNGSPASWSPATQSAAGREHFPYLALAQRNAASSRDNRRVASMAPWRARPSPCSRSSFPIDAQAIDAQLAHEIAALGANAPRGDFAAGVEIGKRAAARRNRAPPRPIAPILRGRVTPRATPGAWVSQAKPPAPPQYTGFIGMRPFFLASGSEFRAPPPPRH